MIFPSHTVFFGLVVVAIFSTKAYSSTPSPSPSSSSCSSSASPASQCDDVDASSTDAAPSPTPRYGRVSTYSYVLTPSQIDAFHQDGLASLPDLLTEAEVSDIEITFDKFLNREIPVPAKDFCDMSKPFGIPFEDWSIVNCMLPTTYHPPFQGNIFERLAANIASQIHPTLDMTKDYDQLLNKRPGKEDAVFAWHQDMGYWPGPKALGVSETSTITFSLAVDNSTPENGCLRYVPGSGLARKLRKHAPLSGESRDDGHALTIDVRTFEEGGSDEVRNAPCSRGSATIHDEWVVHGSAGNRSDRQRRTYVVAFRPGAVVKAERNLGFTHSHNDEVNWDTFQDGEERVSQ